MDPVLIIFCCVCLTAITVLCVVASIAISEARRSLSSFARSAENVSRDFSDLKRTLEPVIHEAHETLSNVSETLDRADMELAKLGKGADVVADIAQDIRKLEQMVVGRISAPLGDVADVVAGTAKGLSTFVRKLFKQ